MARQTLTGTYSAGYILQPRFNALLIAKSAMVEGIGVRASSAATVTILGTIAAADGATEGDYGNTALDLSGGGKVTNSGLVTGGDGQVGNNKTEPGVGGMGMHLASGAVFNHATIMGGVGGSNTDIGEGASGGDAIEIDAAGRGSNAGIITGGAGGNGGFNRKGGDLDGGSGGAGVDLTGDGQFSNNTGTLAGGVGGVGGRGGYYAGSGGGGGAGIRATGAVILTNAATLAGGLGGSGGQSSDYYDNRSTGGYGGDGAMVAGGTVVNIGTLAGGGGGTGGAGRTASQDGGYGGEGLESSASIDLTNSGLLIGGAGGAGGAISEYDGAAVGGSGGSGGDGVFAASGSILNYGSLAGGAGGSDGVTNTGTLIVFGHGGSGGDGVYLRGQGSVTNMGGALAGGSGGHGGSGTTAESYGGYGGAGGVGVVLEAGGTLANMAGVVSGGNGGAGGYGPKYSARGGDGGAGVSLVGGGLVTNSGTILGGAGGTGAGTAPSGANGDAVVLKAGGTVINEAGALISGAMGIDSTGAGGRTVSNYGTIEGTGGVSVGLASVSDRLVAEAGSLFVGDVQGGGGTLEFAGGTGSLSGLGSTGVATGSQVLTFAGFSAYDFDAGGVWTITGANDLAASQSLTDAGSMTVNGALTNAGMISVEGGQTLSLAGGALTNLAGGVLTGGTYSVAAASTLQLANNTAIAQLDAALILSGQNSTIQGLDTGSGQEIGLKTSLTGIGASGVLELLAGRNFAAANAVANSGRLQMAGGSYAGDTLTDAATSTLTGFGTITATFADSGVVTSVGGALAFSGAGDVFNVALGGEEIDFTGGTDLLSDPSSLTAATVALSGGAAVTLAQSLAFGGVFNEGSASLTLAAGAALSLGGAATFGPGAVVKGTGALTLANATAAGLTVAVAVTDSGLIEAKSGTVAFTKALSGAGALTIDAGATLEADGAAARTLTTTFNGAGAVLAMGQAAKFLAAIDGFAVGDTIDLLNTAATGATLQSGGKLVITNGAQTVATLHLLGSKAGETFSVTADGHGGSDITVLNPAGLPPPAAPPTPHALAAAMARLGAGAGAAATVTASAHFDAGRMSLLVPRAQSV